MAVATRCHVVGYAPTGERRLQTTEDHGVGILNQAI